MNENYKVYKHTSPSGKVYIGITRITIEQRWRNGEGYKRQVFYNAIQKYGWDNFIHEVLADNLTKERAELYEIALIAQYKSNNSKYGYNVANGGYVNSGFKHTEETKCKISKANSGKKHTQEWKEENSKRMLGNKHLLGHKHTEETKCKIAKSSIGRETSEETRNKLSIVNSGSNNAMYGKHHSEETRRKISEANKGLQAGSKHPRAKKVYCDGIIFEWIGDCAEYYGLKLRTMRDWLTGKRKMREEFKQMGLSYIEKKEVA